MCCAAVSDYKPVSQAEHKIKKSDEGDSLTISLEKTPDILSTLGTLKSDENHLVGFALETRDGESYAKQKLDKKNASAIVLNTLGKQEWALKQILMKCLCTRHPVKLFFSIN